MGSHATPAPSPTSARWPAVFLYSVAAACVVFLCVFKIYDMDIWLHLRTGQWILAHRAIPRADIFSYTIAGQPWIVHEWLSEVAIYLQYAAAGFAGLTVFKTAVALAIFACIAAYASPEDPWDCLLLAPLCVVAACGLRPGLVNRPQIFTYLLSALFLLILKKGERNPRLPWLLPALELLWVNLHGGACLMGLALIGAWLLGSFRNPGRLPLILALCALASLANPFGIRIFSDLRTAAPQYASIVEWGPLRFTGHWAPIWIPLLALALLSAAAWLARPRRRPQEAWVWFFFLPLSFHAVRFGIEAIPIFAQLAAGNLSGRLSSWRARREVRVGAAALCALSCLAATWFCMTYAYPGTYQPGIGVAYDPSAAIGFLDKAGLKGPLFNTVPLGSALTWFDPGRPVFVDTRNVDYGPEFFAQAQRWYEPEIWRALDDTYHFQIALVENGARYLCGVLDAAPAWRLVYWDDAALVYVRADGVNAAAAKRYGYTLLRPNQLDMGYVDSIFSRPDLVPELLAQARSSVDEAPDALNPRVLEAYILRKLGRFDEAVAELEAAEQSPMARDRATPEYELAVSLQAAGRVTEAGAHYESALQRASRYGETALELQAMNALAILRYRQGDQDGAARLWQGILRLDPGNGTAAHNLKAIGR